jgi:hypothetical protein
VTDGGARRVVTSGPPPAAKEPVEPVAQHAADARIGVDEHEVVGAVHQMQLDRRPGQPHHAERLLELAHPVARAVQDQDRPRRNFSDHLLGPEHEERHGPEAVHHDDRRPPLGGLQAIRHMDHAGKLQAVGIEGDALLQDALSRP